MAYLRQAIKCLFNIKRKIYLVFLFFIFYCISGQPYKIYDITNNHILAADFSVHKNFFSVVFSPFLDIPNYFLRFDNYRIQILSWFIWFLIFGLFIFFSSIRYSKGQKNNNFLEQNRSPIIILKIFLIFWLLIVYVLFFPYSGNKLIKQNVDDVVVDFHSHTCQSWDAVANLNRSIKFHKANGYDAYFITEHDYILTDFFSENIFRSLVNPSIFLGEEIYDFEGVHYILFGLKQSLDVNKLNRNYAQIKEFVEQKGGVIEAALWWQRKKIDFIRDKNIRTMEISNMAYRNLSDKNFESAIKFAKENNVSVTGVTDWHGWGNKSYVWSIVHIPDWMHKNYNERRIALVEALKGKYSIRVLEYNRYNEVTKSTVRYIFEPFFGIFYILTGQNFWGLISWFTWVLLIWKFIIFLYDKRIVYLFWLVSSFIFFGLTFNFIKQWILFSKYNKGLLELSIYLFILGILSFVVFREHKT